LTREFAGKFEEKLRGQRGMAWGEPSTRQKQVQRQKQIPCGNDKQARTKAKANTKATATAKAD
jgi:hypothetical protein